MLTPALIMDDTALAIALNLARMLFGIFLGTAVVIGYALGKLSPAARVLYGVLAASILLPPEAFAGAVWLNVAASVLAAVLLLHEHRNRRQVPA